MLKTLKLLLTTFLMFGILSCTTDEATTDETPIENPEEVSEETTDEETPIDEEGGETENPEEPTEEVEEPENPEEPSVSGSVVGTFGQLSISGSNIVDKNNNPIQLRGMSLFWSQWEGDKYYNQTTVKWLKEDWHATVVRAAMGVEDSGGYISNPDTEKAKVFAVIDAAIAEGVYVIVDWHSHNAENYLQQSKAFFAEVAQKYGNYPNIIYETYNEPIFNNQSEATTWKNILKPYHEEVIAEIRKYDTNNIIVCGTRLWSQRVDEVIGNEINDANVAYTLHYYSSFANHQQPLRDIAQKAIDAGLPLFVTEYGVTLNTGDGNIIPAEAEKWWAFLDENKISWCNWSIVDKSETSAALFPGTTVNNLSVNNLTQSGKMVYDEMISKNQDFD